MVRMSTSKRLLFAGYLILGPVLGMSLNFGNDTLLNICLGFLIALISSFLVFPELRRTFSTIIDGKNSLGFNPGLYLTHPTQKPMMIGVLWSLPMAFLLAQLNSKFPSLIPEEYRLNVTTIIVTLPGLFLFGYSGFKMIKRNETVNKFGKIHKGFWAYLNGTILILIGWGGLLYLLRAWIFDWK
jgi:hypothetical protein